MRSNILDQEVHIWFCQPQAIQDNGLLSAYRSILSASEGQQYERFHYEKDKRSYLVAHALLRHVLSKYADVDASEWLFSGNAHGKPELIRHGKFPAMDFNLTHTDGLSACVVTINRRCGIDAENIHRKNNLSAVARRMFAEEELVAFGENDNSPQQFYDLWTLRESFVKALGSGLAGSSKDFYFTVDEAGSAVCIHFKKTQRAGADHFDTGCWQFRLFSPTPKHRLAVAFDSPDPLQVQIAEFVP